MRKLRCIRRFRPHLDLKTATTIVYFKLDCCSSQINQHLLVQNSPVRACLQFRSCYGCKMPWIPSYCRCSYISTLAEYKEGVKYKLLSVMYKVFTITQPICLHYVISLQSRSTGSFLHCCHPCSTINWLLFDNAHCDEIRRPHCTYYIAQPNVCRNINFYETFNQTTLCELHFLLNEI